MLGAYDSGLRFRSPSTLGVASGHQGFEAGKIKSQGLGFRASGIGFRVSGLGFKVSSFWSRERLTILSSPSDISQLHP